MRGHVGPGCAQEPAREPRGRAAPPGSPHRSPEQWDALFAALGVVPLRAAAFTKYVANVATAINSEAGRPLHPPAGLPRPRRLPSADIVSLISHRNPPYTDGPQRPTSRRQRRLFPSSASAGWAGSASCALKAISTIRGIFNCSIKHAVNYYSQLC